VSKHKLSMAIDQQMIDSALAARPLFLRFPSRLEAEFELETATTRSQRLAVGGLIGLAIYDLLMISDWWLTPDVFSTALWIRFGVVTPIELLSILALWFGPPFLWREAIIAVFGAILPTATHLYIMLSSSSPFQYAQNQAVVLVIMFVVMVQRIRFPFAIPTCLICLLLFAGALSQLPDYPLQLQVAANVTLLSVVIFSLFVSYSLERQFRRKYLLEIKSRLQNRMLDAMSHQDPLTGLQNRRSLDASLASIGSSAEIVSAIIVDIDHFKKFNDTAGHQAGDRCLKSVASLLQETLIEENATVFRYGGEEFLILLAGKGTREAHAIAERLRRRIEGASLRHPGLPGTAHVTASFGVATGPAHGSVAIEEVIGGSDAALYAAKRNGRNQVWPPSVDPSVERDDRSRRTG